MTQATSPDGTAAPCGAWSSPISSAMLAAGGNSLDTIQLDGDRLYCIERRPAEQGRCVILQATEGKTDDLLPAPFSARSRVHEYGGGAFCAHNGIIHFVNDSDQAIYRLHEGEVEKLAWEAGSRFADLHASADGRWLLAVAEHHGASVENRLVAIDTASGAIHTLFADSDFCASARLSPDGGQLCWLSWNHPNMPWDGNQLWLADFHGDRVENARVIAGRQTACLDDNDGISISQPRWSPDGRLFYLSDEDDWWQLYVWQDGAGLRLLDAEQDLCPPQWVFAQSNYAFIDGKRLVTSLELDGERQLVCLDLTGVEQQPARLTPLPTAWQSFDSLAANARGIACIAASPRDFPALIHAPLDNASLPAAFTCLRRACDVDIGRQYFSTAQAVQFENRHGEIVHANYYPPHNPDYRPMKHERPPLIVICHGGPTACAGAELDLRKQYWTSRGFALLDVNYSGSSGFGRRYRLRLNGQWGLRDVEDCCDGARHMAEQGKADSRRLLIRGSSAGGLTVLAALTFHDVFAAGASYYGISELESLATDTHKFEAHYLDRLIGPWPEAKAVYRQRSPLHHAGRLNRPVIFFHGKEDRVVPIEQAERLHRALKEKGIFTEAKYYAGEQHGFRRAETIVDTLESERAFYLEVFRRNP